MFSDGTESISLALEKRRLSNNDPKRIYVSSTTDEAFMKKQMIQLNAPSNMLPNAVLNENATETSLSDDSSGDRAAQPIRIGKTIGKFLINNLIGEGGFGRVYQVRYITKARKHMTIFKQFLICVVIDDI